MNAMAKKIVIIVLAVLVFAGLYTWSLYNRLVVASEVVDGQWAQVEVQYQRRLDLIPNEVAAVKGIFKQEQKVFSDIAEARTRYAGAGTVNEKVAAANQVESAFGRLLAVVESYPELRSAERVQALMDQLEGTENRVSVERRRYNDAVRDFNVMVKRFPARLFVSLFGFSERVYFEAAEGAEVAPQIEI